MSFPTGPSSTRNAFELKENPGQSNEAVPVMSQKHFTIDLPESRPELAALEPGVTGAGEANIAEGVPSHVQHVASESAPRPSHVQPITTRTEERLLGIPKYQSQPQYSGKPLEFSFVHLH